VCTTVAPIAYPYAYAYGGARAHANVCVFVCVYLRGLVVWCVCNQECVSDKEGLG